MIIGADRPLAVSNIRKAAQARDYYRKTEPNDPVLTKAQTDALVERFLSSRNGAGFQAKTHMARAAANLLTRFLNRNTEIVGLEKLPPRGQGCIITSNHFSPVENTVIRHGVRKQGRKRLCVVTQATNLAMPGAVGFLMNYADTLPISDDPHYLHEGFPEALSEMMEKGEAVLIYPEQEMWFHYRKPRPGKRGAYYYAARLRVPVVSCFVEIRSLPEMDTPEFHRVRHVLHILEVLHPDPDKSPRENSVEMCQRDYALKKAAYERIYGKPMIYDFEPEDIAGWAATP